jgi:hypothetical protein
MFRRGIGRRLAGGANRDDLELRQRPQRGDVRDRGGSTLNPPAVSDRFTISTSSGGNIRAIACLNRGP